MNLSNYLLHFFACALLMGNFLIYGKQEKDYKNDWANQFSKESPTTDAEQAGDNNPEQANEPNQHEPNQGDNLEPALEPGNGNQGDTGKAQGPKFVQEYSDPILFMSDFLNVKVKPEKPLKYWALQLVLLMRKIPKLHNFCKKIKNIALNKELNVEQRTKSISGAFIEAYTMQLFSEELSKFIFAKGLTNVRDAIRERAKKAS